ncbi:hypothetical protein VTL71DRAFT_15135 [Oculimacula yallundae]|uniref:Polyketide synthase n=1 Tax=Oculimacula yallundae TaxID=86028 RepID=A0ABR4CFP2_9HELO
MAPPKDATMPIAVIGLSGRFPGQATDPGKLWDMCAAGKNAWSPLPADRFSAEAFYHPDSGRNGTANIKGGFFLKEDLAYFDAPFFSLNVAEAERMLLEASYEAFENAGIRMEDVAGGDTGIFIGTFCKDWENITTEDPDAIPMYYMTGGGHSMLANRLSYFYNLSGPSYTVDTACSASLVAVHLACQSLRAGECRSAVVAGVNCLLDPDQFITLSSLGFLSPDGRCHSFDHRANGYARGEGVSCVILKPLDEALKDGDVIRAVIRNSAMNQDGKTPGITFPSASAQAALAEKVYAQAGLDPMETTYVETHGTGTQAGDPVEASALYSTFGKSREDPLRIGSVKTNVGHLEGASGVTGFIKTVLMLEKEQILPNSGFESPNKRIPLKEWNLEVPTECLPWKRKNGVLRASVQSFGYGGTNAHVIIEDARGYLQNLQLGRQSITNTALASIDQEEEKASTNTDSAEDMSSSEKSWDAVEMPESITGHSSDEAAEAKKLAEPHRLYVVSAYGEDAGKQYLANLHNHLMEQTLDDSLLASLAETLGSHRSALPWKASIPASSSSELISGLRHASFTHATKEPRIAFVFTGQGAQWYAMGRSLLNQEQFRKSLDLCDQVISSLGAGWSVIEELSKDESLTRVNEALLSQPLCTILQIALVDLLKSWNIVPKAAVGHSSGEIAAAYAAGSLSLRGAVIAAYYRGLVVGTDQENTVRGAMAAIRSTHSEALALIGQLRKGVASIACHNSPNSFTISGDESAILELVDLCSTKDIWIRKLAISVAYHSPHMQRFSKNYHAALVTSILDSEETQPSACIQYSSVTGQSLEPDDITSDYWVQNLTSPVLFSDAVKKMCTSEVLGSESSKKPSTIDIVVEIGPHSALAGPLREIFKSDSALAKVVYISALNRQEDAMDTTMKLASRLFERGCPVDIPAINQSGDGKRPSILVNLPSYAWNHSTKYWAEPRVHKDYRLRKWPRHDLLGAPVKFSNSLEPRFRNWIRLQELPWLRDHRVQGLIVYPAAGYISMAIEAAHQRAVDMNITIEGYDLREINLSQALVIPESTGEVEVMFCIKPHPESSKSSSGTWDEFFVYSASDKGDWVEHCRGHISVRQPVLLNVVDGQRQKDIVRLEYARKRSTADSECTQLIEGSDLYAQCTKIGLEYGPTFANLAEAKVGPSGSSKTSFGSIGRVLHPDIAKVMPENHQYPSIIHPSVLDAFFHVAIAAPKGLKSAAVPTFISNVFVSNSLASKPQHEFSVYGVIEDGSQRTMDISLDVYDNPAIPNLPSVEVKGLQMTSLNGQQTQESTSETRKSYYRTAYRPDVSLMSLDQFSGLCSHLQPSDEQSYQLALIDEAVHYLADEAIGQIPESALANLSPKGVKLYHSLKRIVQNVIDSGSSEPLAAWVNKGEQDRAEIVEIVRKSGDEGNFAVLVGKNFKGIIEGTINPLALTIKDDALGRYYANNLRMACQCAVYIDLLAHKDPHLRVLEIGAGTGGATLPVLNALGGMNDKTPPRFLSYDITDITTGFFEKLQEKTVAWGDLVSYKKLDIESDPSEQGFESGYYDVIIAANVLHATKNMGTTMANVRSLLKKGGNLILVELMPKAIGVTNIFGIFDGWWMGSEDDRQNSPLMTEERWDVVLQNAGFQSLNLTLPDTSDAMTHQGKTMISKATESQQLSEPGSALALAEHQQNEETIIVKISTIQDDAGNIASSLVQSSVFGEISPDVVEFDRLQARGRICIFLELDNSILSDMTESKLQNLKSLFGESKGVLWITRGASHDSSNPNLSLVSGFLRTLRIETGLPLIHLDLDPQSADSTLSATTIAQVYRSRFLDSNPEFEFVEREGRVMIPRHMEDDISGRNISGRIGHSSPEIDEVSQEGRPLRLQIAQLGLLDTFYYDDDKRGEVDLPKDYIEIEVKATALNFRDVMMAMGQIETTALGYECSGIVTKIGSSIQSFQIGDRVMAVGDGTFATFARFHDYSACKIPDTMSFETAASIPVAYGTAYHALKAARLTKEDTVLIHAATGALGQALIMMCQRAGARILATVGTSEKKAFLMSELGIEEEAIFYSRDTSFKAGVMRATYGVGVDVIFNSLSSELQRVTWECIAPYGRFIELGRRDFIVNSRLEQDKFKNNVTFTGLDFRHMKMTRPRWGKEAYEGYMPLIESGEVKAPSPIRVFGGGEVETAFRTMQSGKHIGKLVVVPKAGDVAKIMPREAPKTVLSANATYLLVGGMGGIGRALALKLVDSGAKNLVFLSRSGAKTSAAKDLIEALQKTGANILVLECDVSDKQQLSTVISEINETLPPIKGVFHLAMVMRSALFSNMSLTDWTSSLAPKVLGTWNLHDLLPDLDLFILISSFVGVIGNASQAAYSAASSFQDAFSTYRNSLGLPAITVDLGLVTEIGYVADRNVLESKLKSQGYEDISAAECMAIIEEAIAQPFQSKRGGNLITGFGLGRWSGGDVHHASHQTPQSSHVRRLALSAVSGGRVKEEAAVAFNVRGMLKNAGSLEVAETHVLEAIKVKLASLLMLSLDDIDSSRPMSHYGLDSLVAVEMRNWIASEIEATVPVLELLGNQSILELAKSITQQSRIVKKLLA